MKFNSLELRGTALLMLCLFSPYLWYFVPKEILWSFPFFDADCRCFSFSPKAFRTYQLRDILPLYAPFFLSCIYIYARGLFPIIKVSIYKWTVNIWMFHFWYMAVLAIDLFASFSHTPVIRTIAIVIGCVLHSKWLLDNNR